MENSAEVALLERIEGLFLDPFLCEPSGEPGPGSVRKTSGEQTRQARIWGVEESETRGLGGRGPVPDGGGLNVVELARRHPLVQAPFLREVVVGPHFDDFPLVDHDNPVGVADGREPMSNDERRASFEDPFDSIHNQV